MTRIITFISGKGGVGKTTVSSNFAEALNQSGKKVLIIDANITTPNLALHYGIINMTPTIQDVLNGKYTIKDAIYKTNTGLLIIPGGLNFKNLKKTIKKSLATELVKLIDDIDYIIIDSSAGLGGETQLAINASDEVIIVTNPEIPAITDALRSKKLCEEYRVNLLGVVLNKFTGFDFDLKKKNIEDFLELPILGTINHDINIKKAINERLPVVISYPHSKSAKAIKKLVNTVTKEELFVLDKPDNKFISWIKKKLKF